MAIRKNTAEEPITVKCESAPFASNAHPNFENSWPKIEPVCEKIMKQQNVTKEDWFETVVLNIHQACLWDDTASAKLHKALDDKIALFKEQGGTIGPSAEGALDAVRKMIKSKTET